MSEAGAGAGAGDPTIHLAAFRTPLLAGDWALGGSGESRKMDICPQVQGARIFGGGSHAQIPTNGS